MISISKNAYEQAAELLNSNPDYRVLRRLQPITSFHPQTASADCRVGVAIDVETTGLNYASDKIIELALQRFRYDEQGRIVQVGQPRVWREDPDRELSPQITKLTGLTADLLKEQEIDESVATEILSSADLIVAHNAAFDRPFVDKRLPGIAGKAWACSMVEIDWLELGFDGRALAHLLSQCGWFYEGHRAESDTLALLYLLAHKLPDGSTILSALCTRSQQLGYQVNAIGAPFDAKDLLKARGYKWDNAMRCWSREITEAQREEEAIWLATQVYTGYVEPAFIPVSACDRYSRP